MHFEKSLSRSVYPPWKDKYIDYPKLKSLLRDEGSDAGSSAGRDADDAWTEEDEGAFVEELVNVQLEKVHAFQADMLQKLRDRTSACEQKLEPVSTVTNASSTLHPETQDSQPSAKVSDDQRGTLENTLKELDGITNEMNELEKFSRINYTGFLKATKKHDRRRGGSYRVRPLMQVRLAALPFNKEDYAPLLFRLSTMYNFIRQNLDSKGRQSSAAESHSGSDEFTSHKFWVHPDNILELKTMILRRLPVLVYNPQSSKVAEGGRSEPSITSIYFDNPSFDLYNTKIEHQSTASSLRMRWYGSLNDNPEIYCERKTVSEDDVSREEKITMKSKYVQRFINGEYKMDKDVQKLKDRLGDDSVDQVEKLRSQVDDIQGFIEASELQPVLRANYTRSAFQIPGDSRVRITLDTDIALIREDALDPDRPCRDPETWHRKDIDDLNVEYPFEKINKGEINRFPFALLEVRIRGSKRYEWTQDLMSSHLVHPAPRFSKFIHGVAQLFDDYVNTFPFWLAEVDQDIRQDPQEAFEEEQARRLKVAEDEFAVGSLLKTATSQNFKVAQRSPMGSPQVTPKQQRSTKITPEMTRKASQQMRITEMPVRDEMSSEDSEEISDSRGFKSLFPSLTRFAQMHKSGQVKLPPGVHEPSFWIKDEGEVKVEAKVWLANQRTFIKWQHVGILLSSLSLGLFNAAGANNSTARIVAVVYTVIGVGTALWGFGMYLHRSTLIRKRSGKDFDNVFGPIVVCIALIFALLFNFGFKYQALKESRKESALINWSNQTNPNEL